MTQIKCWIDDEGYGFQFEDSRIELSHDGLNEFIAQLCKIQDMTVDDGQSLATEFCIDLEDE